MQSVNSDAFPCTICGMLIWAGNVHTCGGTPTLPPTPPYSTAGSCLHCYCKIERADTASPAHRICCNCGNRQATVTWGT